MMGGEELLTLANETMCLVELKLLQRVGSDSNPSREG